MITCREPLRFHQGCSCLVQAPASSSLEYRLVVLVRPSHETDLIVKSWTLCLSPRNTPASNDQHLWHMTADKTSTYNTRPTTIYTLSLSSHTQQLLIHNIYQSCQSLHHFPSEPPTPWASWVCRPYTLGASHSDPLSQSSAPPCSMY
jgi:hypothetical protein